MNKNNNSATEEEEKEFNRDNNPNFFKLWDIMSIKKWTKKEDKGKKDWFDYEIYAKTTRYIEEYVGNGENNKDAEKLESGTKVRVWMVSRMGHVGITGNIINPIGYKICVDADKDLTDYEFIEKIK